MLPQPNKLLGVKDKTSADAAAVLRKTINDDYLKFDCHRIVSKSFLERPECLIAVGQWILVLPGLRGR